MRHGNTTPTSMSGTNRGVLGEPLHHSFKTRNEWPDPRSQRGPVFHGPNPHGRRYSRDGVGLFANGKVYLATFSNRINVYGLLPPPMLSATPASGRLAVSWPQSASAYTLQSSPSLNNQVWSNVTNTGTRTNGLLQVTLPETVGSMFYRLKY